MSRSGADDHAKTSAHQACSVAANSTPAVSAGSKPVTAPFYNSQGLPAPPPRRRAAAEWPALAAPSSCWSTSRRWGTPLPGTACRRERSEANAARWAHEPRDVTPVGRQAGAAAARTTMCEAAPSCWHACCTSSTHWLAWVRSSTRRGGSRRRLSAASHSSRASMATSSSPASESSLSTSSRSAADGGGGVGGAGMCAGGPAGQGGVAATG